MANKILLIDIDINFTRHDYTAKILQRGEGIAKCYLFCLEHSKTREGF